MRRRRRPDLHTLDPMERRSPFLVAFFGRVMARAMARNFHTVRVAAPGPPQLPADRPMVVYANHPSWWDPAFFMVLATRLFANRQGYGPIDAEELARYRFMTRIGVFGVEPTNPGGAVRFLDTGVRILSSANALLWITPEGRFVDPRERPVRLRRGLAHLARRSPQALLVPLALEYVFWTERFPEALCRFGPAIDAALHRDLTVLEWTRLLEEQLAVTMDALADDVVARDPDRFHVLLEGRAGVGGVYDLWRRAKAHLRGERFRPEHGRP